MLRPGFLSREYMAGRRASYLNPIRMYVFTSAFFFLTFFTFFNSELSKTSIKNINGKTLPEIARMDSAKFADFTRAINKDYDKPDKPMTRAEFKQYSDTLLKNSTPAIAKNKYETKALYDSALASGIEKDNWLVRQFKYKSIDIQAKYGNDDERIKLAFVSTLLHSLPQMLFISLPLLALLLKLLYVRRKQVYYVNHAIFSMHLYIFVFIALLIALSLAKLNEQLHWGVINFIRVMLYLGLFYYEYKAMRNFYQQGRAKTILKFILVNLLFMIVVDILFLAFVLFSFYKI